MKSFRFTVPFARGQKRSRKGQNGWYAPSSQDQQIIAQYALVARQSARLVPFEGEIYFYLTAYGLQGDVDNCLKLCMDACNGVAYQDDKQVAFASCRKIPSEEARMDVEIAEMG